MLRPEQKNISLAEGIVEKFTKTCRMVKDPFIGTLPSAMACVNLKKYCKFVRCDVDANRTKLLYLSLLRVFTEQVLCSESQIAEEPELERAAMRFILFLNAQDRREVLALLSLPGGLQHVQKVLRHILLYLYGYHTDFESISWCAHISVKVEIQAVKNRFGHGLQTSTCRRMRSDWWGGAEETNKTRRSRHGFVRR